MIHVGVDYSMSCPGVCIMRGSEWNLDNLSIFFLTGNKKVAGSFHNGQITSELFKPWTVDTIRFLQNAHAIKAWINPTEDMNISIEGYAFAAKGSRIFQIGEATGILKTLLTHSSEGSLINQGRNLTTIAPSANKKFATGKGNADKKMMYDAFVEDTNNRFDLINTLGLKKLDSPAHDIADAYWLCKFAHNATHTNTPIS